MHQVTARKFLHPLIEQKREDIISISIRRRAVNNFALIIRKTYTRRKIIGNVFLIDLSSIHTRR